MGLLGKDVCLKCDRGGDVLVCSTSSCPLAVHKKCLGFQMKVDEKGKFYCPYCVYRKLVEESDYAKEKALSRKKSLLIFLDRKLVNGDCQTQECGNSNCKEQTHPLDARKICDPRTEDDENQVNKVNVPKHTLKDKYGQQKGVAAECSNFVPQSQEDDVLCQSNHCNCLSTYGDIAMASDKHHLLLVVGQRTVSGPVVACGQDCVDSEDEETLKRFKMVEIGNKIPLQPQLKDDGYQSQRHIEIHNEANHFQLLPSEDEETVNRYEMVHIHKNIQLQQKDDSYQPWRHDEYQLEGKHCVDPIVSGKEGKEKFLKVKKEANDGKTVQKTIVKNEGRKQVKGQVNRTDPSSHRDILLPMHLLEKRGSGADDSMCTDSESAVNGKRFKYDGENRGQSMNENCMETFRKSAAGLRAYVDKLEKLVAARESRKSTKLDSTFEFFSNGRRKSMPWADEEVNMLKESVRIFSTTVNKNIPWSKILSFGRHVFDGSRNPVDLKEKWRRLAKERQLNY